MSAYANYQTESFLREHDSTLSDPELVKFTMRTTCRLCGSEDLVPALTLQPTPPANAFLSHVPDEPEVFLAAVIPM